MPNLPDVLAYQELGGSKQNYSDPADATTDRDAAEANLAFGAVAAMSRTADRAWVKWLYNGVTITVVDFDAVWGKSVAPVVARSATGIFTVTWPATVTDELGVQHSVNLRIGVGNIEDSSFQPSVNITAPNVARVRFTNPATGANVDPTNTPVCMVLK